MQSGPAFWLILLTVGVAALGLLMAYASSRNKKRTPQERLQTEAATRQEYRAEHQDDS